MVNTKVGLEALKGWFIPDYHPDEPAKSEYNLVPYITEDIATILQNSYENKDEFYLKYAN